MPKVGQSCSKTRHVRAATKDSLSASTACGSVNIKTWVIAPIEPSDPAELLALYIGSTRWSVIISLSGYFNPSPSVVLPLFLLLLLSCFFILLCFAFPFLFSAVLHFFSSPLVFSVLSVFLVGLVGGVLYACPPCCHDISHVSHLSWTALPQLE